MVRRVSAGDARARFEELTDEVRDTGEPIIVEKGGQPAVAVVSLQDFDAMERTRQERAAAEFTRLGREAAHERQRPGPTEEETLEAIKRDREAWYRERYGTG